MDIKFSHMYSKLTVPGPTTARIQKGRLLEVIKLDIRTLSKWFLAYDTDNGSYRLPDRGIVLLLIFEKILMKKMPGRELFTTIRAATPGKEVYYRRCLGKVFNVQVIAPISRKKESEPPSLPGFSSESPDTSSSAEPATPNESTPSGNGSEA